MKTLKEFIDSIEQEFILSEEFRPLPEGQGTGFYHASKIGDHTVQLKWIKPKLSRKYHTIVTVNGKLHSEDNPNMTSHDKKKIALHVADIQKQFLEQKAGKRTVVAKANSPRKKVAYKAIAPAIASGTGHTAGTTIGGHTKFTNSSSTYTPPPKKPDKYPESNYDDDVLGKNYWMWKGKKFSKKTEK